ncbi:ATP-binding protein [Actinoplanes sichuanensis]|uniref:ATP-binding protein n=1 Tax=Actinoplanes sichuanensis TaxID=512349 RepID=UPI00366E7851
MFGHDDPAAPLRRSVLTSLAERFGATAGDAWVDDVLIAVSELVQNVSQHTGGGGELSLSATADGVLIEVADTAVTPPRLRHPDPRHAGGRGLLLIDAMALDWGTRHHDDGKTVWALMPAPVLAGALPA